MRLLAGTSGFSYRAWQGSFYPERIAAKEMLSHYAQRLPTVEINNTFYRLPKADVVRGWRAQVPPEFRFAVKAPQRITHRKRLRECGDDLAYFAELLTGFDGAVGAVLFQLPPFARRATELLAQFIAQLPQGMRAAFEFRHRSWFEPDVYEALAGGNCALVLSETDESAPPVEWTADWAYLRLRKTSYSDAELAEWYARLRAAELDEALVYFKHEDEGVGPRLAAAFLELDRESAA